MYAYSLTETLSIFFQLVFVTIQPFSNSDKLGAEIYELYKRRGTVEKMFDTYKTVLEADKIYLQDDESVFGHVFISFRSLYIHCKLEGRVPDKQTTFK